MLICLAGWLNQCERTINEYVRAENRILREQLGKKRLRLTDDQRRRLAVLGKTLVTKGAVGVGLHRDPRHHHAVVPQAHRLEMGLQRETRPRLRSCTGMGGCVLAGYLENCGPCFTFA